MRILLTIAIFLVGFTTSAQARMSYNSGQYYSQQGAVQAQCGRAYVVRQGYRSYCQQNCKVAQWQQQCGGGFVNVWMCNHYGNCSWQSQYSNGCRWMYRWRTEARALHYSYCY